MSAREMIEDILTKVAESEEIANFEAIPDDDVLRGDGFLSECHTGAVRNKDTGELIQTYIKLPPKHKVDFIQDVYVNEYNFYSNIYPELDKFQREKNVKVPFDKISKFYCGSAGSDKYYITLENLKVQNYVLHDKSEFIDEKHLRRVFATYGKYHALTFAFKEQNREKYEELVKPLIDIYSKFQSNQEIQDALGKDFERAYNIIKEIDDEKAAKVKPLLDDLKETTARGTIYYGKHSALIHGDCWSNNIMFKYDANGEIENIRLLDHQLLRDSTPIHDLSYFLYAGAAKKDFDKLDAYLDLYYKNFSSFARELGSDPDKLLPLDVLKEEWKTYSFLGIIMALMVWPVKLLTREEVLDFNGDESEKKSFHENFQNVVSSDAFKKIVSDLLIHAVEYNIL